MSFQFDATQYDPSTAIEAWPAGWNKAVIVSHTTKANSKGNGGHLMLGLKHGETGKPAFIQLNLWHDNEQPRDIANRELSAIVHVTLGVSAGRFNFQDPSELYNIPFFILNQPDAQGRNDFKGYKDTNGNDPKRGGGGGAPAPGGMPTGAPAGVPGQPGPGFGAPAGQPAQPGGFPAGMPAGGQPAGFPGAPAGQPAQQPGFQPGQPAQPAQPQSGPWGGPQGGAAPGTPAQVPQFGGAPAGGGAPGGWNPGGGGGAPAGQPGPAGGAPGWAPQG